MDFSVIVGTHAWTLGGVTVFSANLVRGLLARGIRSHILVTGNDQLGSPQPRRPDLPIEEFNLPTNSGWRTRWRAMARYLEERAPCIYLPNSDYGYACVSPILSDRVVIVGTIHANISGEFELFRLLGRYWNATVTASQAIAAKAAAVCPDLAHRVVLIPYGVSLPARMPTREVTCSAPLRIVYCGRLSQVHKRVLDLPRIIDALLRRDIPVHLTFTGAGADEPLLRAASQHLIDQGVVRFCGIIPDEDLSALYEQSDVFILTSDSEGKPLALIEAMGHGCVPVVTEIPSGIPELVNDGVNGYRVPVGAIDVFADRLALLYRDVGLRHAMSLRAYATTNEGGYRIEDMAGAYARLFREVWQELESGRFQRPRGRAILPAFMREPWRRRLPAPVRATARRAKALLRNARGVPAVVARKALTGPFDFFYPRPGMTEHGRWVYDDASVEIDTAGSLSSARVVVPILLTVVNPKSVVDVGCGYGAWLKAFAEHGVAAIQGLDGPWVDQSKLLIDRRHFRVADLTKPLEIEGHFDLALCLEVAEHLPARAANPLVRALTAAAPLVLFSAAIPGQGGTRHINEQWPDYWKSLFAERGFQRLDLVRPRVWRCDQVKWWYRQNIFLYASTQGIARSPDLEKMQELTHGEHLELVHEAILSRYKSLSGLLRELPRAVLRAFKRHLQQLVKWSAYQ